MHRLYIWRLWPPSEAPKHAPVEVSDLPTALVASNEPVFMHWVRAHAGLPGNERYHARVREASAI